MKRLEVEGEAGGVRPSSGRSQWNRCKVRTEPKQKTLRLKWQRLVQSASLGVLKQQTG